MAAISKSFVTADLLEVLPPLTKKKSPRNTPQSRNTGYLKLYSVALSDISGDSPLQS
jgi:hypothetical protein